MIVVLGALVAAQGAFASIWGAADWLTVTFILFGVLLAAGGGFDAAFKPGERSPRFAEVGFGYERAHREALLQFSALNRSSERDAPADPAWLEDEMDKMLREIDAKVDSLTEKELALYVAGPKQMGEARAPIR